MIHEHKIFEIKTEYLKDKPAKVISVKCTDCEEEMIELVSLFQTREDEIFKAYGNKSPYIPYRARGSIGRRTLIRADHPSLSPKNT